MMLCIRRSRKLTSTRIRLFPKRLAYLRSQLILGMSLAQFLLGIAVIVFQVVLLEFLSTPIFGGPSLMVYGNISAYAPGIWIAGLQMIGSGLTIIVAVEPVYFWVHIAMAFNVMGVLGNLLASGFLICFELPAFAVIQARMLKSAEAADGDGNFEKLFYCTLIMAIWSVASLFIGSFLAAATGFPIFCGFPKSDMRSKTSPRSSLRSGTKINCAVDVAQIQSPVSKTTFDPTNVAANLNFNNGELMNASMENVPI